MLHYRPLLAAYQKATLPQVRRFLLRQLASPHLHAEPEELIELLAKTTDTTITNEPERLSCEMSLRERQVVLQLTTRDPERRMGGLWTMHSSASVLNAWRLSQTPAPALCKAAGSWLSGAARDLLERSEGIPRVLTLVALGNLGADLALEPLAAELLSGKLPSAAAAGLGWLGTREAEDCLLPAVQARGLDQSAPWLALALCRLPSSRTAPLVVRMGRSGEASVREQAAWALGAFVGRDTAPLLEPLANEADPFVRLSLIVSLSRLELPGGMAMIARCVHRTDPSLVRVTALRAAGAYLASGGREYLEVALTKGDPIEKAEALETLVGCGVEATGYLDQARVASRSSNSRHQLVGLLALAIWAPAEAFERARAIFQKGNAAEWFMATYVLRYLRTDQTVPLLLQLCRKVRGTKIEEVAVVSLCRHLRGGEPPDRILAMIEECEAPAVLQKMTQEIARHLPDAHTGAAAATLRRMLDRATDPARVGPLLIALGAMGENEDLTTICSWARDETALPAIHALELMACPEAATALAPLAKDPRPPVQQACLVAQFRAGLPEAVHQLDILCQDPDRTALAAPVLLGMSLSVRCVKEVSRLSYLYAALEARTSPADRQPVPPPPGARPPGLPAPELSSPGSPSSELKSPGSPSAGSPSPGSLAPGGSSGLPSAVPPRVVAPTLAAGLEQLAQAAAAPPVRAPGSEKPAQGASAFAAVRTPGRESAPGIRRTTTKRPVVAMEDVLSQDRRALHISKEISLGKPQSARPTGLYRALGEHLTAEKPTAPERPWKPVAMFACALLLSIGGAYRLRAYLREHGIRRTTTNGKALYRMDKGPDDGLLHAGDVVVSPDRTTSIDLQSFAPEDRMTISGRVRIRSAELEVGERKACVFEGELIDGAMAIQFQAGEASVDVEAARSRVAVTGSARLELRDGLLRISVKGGQARIFRGLIPMKTLHAGESGDFLDGNPIGGSEQ